MLDGERRRLLGYVLDAGERSGRELYEAVAAQDRNLAESLSGWLVDAPDVEQIEYAFARNCRPAQGFSPRTSNLN